MPEKQARGFATMQDRERQREIAAMGGRASHAAGTAHRWSKEEAREAGRKGGLVPKIRKRRVLILTPEPPA